jgi:hypothetical protein
LEDLKEEIAKYLTNNQNLSEGIEQLQKEKQILQQEIEQLKE